MVQNKEKRNTKAEIITAAIDMYSEKGVSAVSIRDITKRVGINESSLYNHFKSKDEILDSIIEQFQKELGEVSFSIDGLEQRITGIEPEVFFQHHIISFRDRLTPVMQKIWTILYIEQFRDKRARDFVLREIIGRPAMFYEEAFKIMIKNGQIRDMDPKLLSDELNYGLLAISLERMLRQTNQEDLAPIVKKMFAHIKFICDSIKK